MYATVDLYPLKSLGPGRLLATFLCLLLPSLRPIMVETVSPLIVSLSLVDMLFLVFLFLLLMMYSICDKTQCKYNVKSLIYKTKIRFRLVTQRTPRNLAR